MKPSQTANILRRIASAIENSKNPDRNLVAKDIKAVLQRLAAGDVVKELVDLFKKEYNWGPRTDFIVENKDDLLKFIEDEVEEGHNKDILLKHFKKSTEELRKLIDEYPKYGMMLYDMAKKPKEEK